MSKSPIVAESRKPIRKAEGIGEMSSPFDAEEVSRVSSSPFGDDGYIGFDRHVSSQSYGSYSTFAADEEEKDSIQISGDGLTSSGFPTVGGFVHDDSILPSPDGYGYLSDQHQRFNSIASHFSMPDSNGSAFGEGVNGGVFISDDPILSTPSEMQPDEGFFLREWRRFELENMEASLEQCTQPENDEEYVLLDLENVCMQADIPANTPYTLSGLDTLNPTLTIGNRLKLIGEYQETIGTCYMFCERDAETAVKNQQHTGGQNQSPCKEIRLVASTQKILKFRLQADEQTENAL